MGLADRNLGAGFMNTSSGANSSMDEQEIIRQRLSSGGRAPIEDMYDRTGNMRVAQTLAKYMNGGRNYQTGGKAGDPYEYKRDGDNVLTRKKDGGGDWNVAEGKAREAIIKNGLVDKAQGAQSEEPLELSLEEQLTLPEDDPKRLAYDQQQQVAKDKAMNADIDQMEANVRQNSQVPLSNNNPGQSTTVMNNRPMEAREEPLAVQQEVVPEEAPATGGGGGGWVDPRKPYDGPEVQRVEGYADMGTAPGMGDLSMIQKRAPAGEEVVAQAAGPNWWDENQRAIGRGVSNAGTAFLNIAPNIANLNDLNNMEGVRASNLARTVTSEAPSMEASRQAIIAQGRNQQNRVGTQGGGQGTAAQNAAAMAGTQSALSQLGGQEAQVQAQTDARNAQAQNQTQRSNVATMNRDQQQRQSRDLAQMRGIAGERNAIANKSLGFMGDLNNQRLQKDKMDLTRQRYDLDDQMKRAQLDHFEKYGVLPEYSTKNDNR